MNRIIIILLLPLCSVLAQEQQANLELAVPFTDYMILQRQTNLPGWGFALPTTKVTVEFAGQRNED